MNNPPSGVRTRPTILYRASVPGLKVFTSGSHWSESLEVAKAYTDNPGFGGPIIYVTTAKGRILDLSDPSMDENLWQLKDAIDRPEEDLEDWREFSYIFQLLENRSELLAELEERFDWVKFIDDFPEGAITWRYLGTAKLVARVK